MSDTHTPTREALSASAAQALALLPRMGRLMVIGRAPGVTHERIGPVEAVTQSADALLVGGTCHDARIDPAQVDAVVLDTHSTMGGKPFPRLEFMGAGAVLFSVVGMEGLDAFTSALSDLPRNPVPVPEAEPRGAASDLDPADPSLPVFEAARDGAGSVRITFDNGTLRQSWQGQIEAIKPAMGFLNVMTPDFHLHLKGGGLSGWLTEPGRRIALNHDAQPAGLVVEADCLA